MDGQRPEVSSAEPSIEEIVRREIEAEEARQPRRPARPEGPRRRWWLLLLSALVGLGTAAVYFMQSGREPDKLKLLEFVSLYLAFPLAMSVLLLFAYFSYPKK